MKQPSVTLEPGSLESHLSNRLFSDGIRIVYAGKVAEWEEAENGVWRGIIEGSGAEKYAIAITLEADRIAEVSCECQAKTKPFCKHITAGILTLRQGGGEQVIREYFRRKLAAGLPKNYTPGDALGPHDTLHLAGKVFDLVRSAEFEIRDGRPGMAMEAIVTTLEQVAEVSGLNDAYGQFRQAMLGLGATFFAAYAHGRDYAHRAETVSAFRAAVLGAVKHFPGLSEHFQSILSELPS